MNFYRRQLPHLFASGRPIFLTWRLHGSLPRHRWFPGGGLRSGKAFVALDRLLDESRSGPQYLGQPSLAEMVVEAIHYNERALRQYELHSFVVMPNHVHLLITPAIAIRLITKSLKGITAKRANLILGRFGQSFWQSESYDHLVRNDREFERICRYIEQNPVRAGLVAVAEDYRWSSAGATGGRPADQGSAPQTDRDA